ncbi:C45 family peptidase [Salinarimonas sp.]|uniref:C45 family peptidase n=1 Tax=Salinarimonas sp. TaxID=2766526 RepID=UPI0032D9461E
MRRVPVIALRGPPRLRGEAHGRAAGDRIRGFLHDGHAWLDRLSARQPFDRARASEDLAGIARAIAHHTPDLWSEIEGLAIGAGVPLEDAVLLQARRELMGYSRFDTLGDCTTIAVAENGRSVLAQTVDLAGPMDEQLHVLETSGEGIAGGRAVIVTFTGLLGYLGMNAAGLAVGLNLVLAGEWGAGVPPYLVIRHLIDRARDVPEALAMLETLPLASSRSFMLCDPRRVACVEAAPGRLRVIEGARLAHANHFEHPDHLADDTLNIFARNGSTARRRAAASLIDALPDDAEAILDALAQPPVNVRPPAGFSRERTVAAVVLEPAAGRITLRGGDPRRGPGLVLSARAQYPNAEALP